MKPDKSKTTRLKKLRRQAEKRLSEKSMAIGRMPAADVKQLLHQLEVHQIELEIQNEELRRNQNELTESRNRYSDLYTKYLNLYNFAPVGYFVIDEKAAIEEVNLTGAEFLGVDRHSLIGKPLIRFIDTNDRAAFDIHRAQVFKKNIIHNAEIKMINYDNASFYARFGSTAVRVEGKNAAKMRSAVTDITDRKMIEQQLRTSLKEKEILLQEVHHRVKNNMQVIIGLISLQCETTEDSEICTMFNKTVERINSMALVHKQLYKSRDFSKVDINQYTNSIAENLFASHDVDTARIALKTDKNDIVLGLDNAISCGLIINELITNSLKHAFPENREGEIRIAFGYSGDRQMEMRISDDGVGLPVNIDLGHSNTLGLQLVKTIAEHQLKGSLDVDTAKGTKFIIRFKEQDHRRII